MPRVGSERPLRPYKVVLLEAFLNGELTPERYMELKGGPVSPFNPRGGDRVLRDITGEHIAPLDEKLVKVYTPQGAWEELDARFGEPVFVVRHPQPKPWWKKLLRRLG